MINTNLHTLISTATGATQIIQQEVIQSLWSGYGEIIRFALTGADRKTVIVKQVRLPEQSRHPRGWNTDISHQRKIKSYEVETAWYQNWSKLCDQHCRIPQCLALDTQGDEVLMVLEDLDNSGFPERKDSVSLTELKVCLSWLANFHATFMGHKPAELWPTGSYWHLDTRPDELQALTDIDLKQAAHTIDKKLQDSPYQTIIHGDAKLANFCFSRDGKTVAAVDFQYVGGGCGMKDVAYFISSCLYENECERLETQLLDYYFLQLKTALLSKQVSVDADAVVQNWRALYPFAWTDFHRFLKGWSPDHWKIHSYSEQLARQVVAQLNQETLAT